MRFGLTCFGLSTLLVVACTGDPGLATSYSLSDACVQPLTDVATCFGAGSSDAGCADEVAALTACQSQAGAAAVDSTTGIIDIGEQALYDLAKRCYEAGNATCLVGVYRTLAVGASVLGLFTASRHMHNFLNCTHNDTTLACDPMWIFQDPIGIPQREIDGDSGATSWFEGLTLSIHDDLLSRAQLGGTHFEVPVPPLVVTASDTNLYYGLGSFTLSDRDGDGRPPTTVDVKGRDGDRFQVSIGYHLLLSDRYDWHPGAHAEGDAGSVALFPDSWAKWLVRTGYAREFDVRAAYDRVVDADIGPGDVQHVFLPAVGR